MVEVRPNPPRRDDAGDHHAADAQPASAHQSKASRLNLLLSYGGWQDNSWADRLPRLLEPMGVRSFCVTNARDAQQLVAEHAVHIAVVDLSLPLSPADEPATQTPAEAGTRLLEILARQSRRPALVVVKRRRPARQDARELTTALQLGAFAALDPPVQLEPLLNVLRRILKKHYADRWPQCDPASPATDP